MTRSFLKRSAVATVLLAIGAASVYGSNSWYDRLIATWPIMEVAIVLAVLIAFWVALVLWVVSALKPTKWARREAAGISNVIALISALCLGAQRADAFVILPVAQSNLIQLNPIETVEIHQPFVLSAEVQRQVDIAVEKASKEARDNPGFVVTVEAAIGIFIAAVIVGTVLVIIVRLVCKSLDRMKASMQNRLSRLKEFLEDPTSTNKPVLIGAGLFRGRDATINDLPTGSELVVGLTAPEPGQPFALNSRMARPPTISWAEFLSDFGLSDLFPSDSVVGDGVSRGENGFVAAPNGQTNLVTLLIEAKDGLANAYKSVLRLQVPVGATLDVSDLSGASDGRFWRVGVAK